jgi:hypothetical protein
MSVNPVDRFIHDRADRLHPHSTQSIGSLLLEVQRLGLKTMAGNPYRTARGMACAISRAYRVALRDYGKAEAGKIAEVFVGASGKHCW